MSDYLASRHCVPCEKKSGINPYTREEAEALLPQLAGWTLTLDAKTIAKEWKFSNFEKALAFADKIGAVAEQESHHPDLAVGWGKVGVTLSTHAIDGLSENDFILAAKIDAL